MRSTSPAIQPRPFRHLVFAPALGQELHADANAEERPALAPHRFLERLDHAGDGIEPAPAIGKGADAGQHDAIGARHHGRIARHHDRLTDAGVLRRALERLGGRMQIAGAVIDDGDAHRGTPGSGKRPITPDDAAGAACAVGAAGGGVALAARWAATAPHAPSQSKNRRSASSRSSPLTMPTFLQPRRRNVKRRSVLASSPTSAEIKMPTRMTIAG